MTERKVLPERYRRAFNLKEGMEVGDLDSGDWWEIASVLRVYSPVNAVWVKFTDGVEANYHPRDEVMSR
jgi:hypothetical protein